MLETPVWSSPPHCEDEGVEAQGRARYFARVTQQVRLEGASGLLIHGQGLFIKVYMVHCGLRGPQ